VIEAVDPSSPVSERLRDLGFLPGTPVRALRRAPLGDPVLYEIRGAHVCLRRSEAEGVRVRLAPAAPQPAGERP
jgi:ferrous iron transport protein A